MELWVVLACLAGYGGIGIIMLWVVIHKANARTKTVEAREIVKRVIQKTQANSEDLLWRSRQRWIMQDLNDDELPLIEEFLDTMKDMKVRYGKQAMFVLHLYVACLWLPSLIMRWVQNK